MFSLKHEKFGNKIAYILINEKTGEYAQIIPACGAILNKLSFKFDNEFCNVIDGFTDSNDFIANNSSSFKSNILFPLPNRIKNGKYSFEGKTYTLPLNFPDENNAIHGLVYDKVFETEELAANDEAATLSLLYESDQVEGYPFQYSISVNYILTAEALKILTRIENCGNEDIPIGFGWHHYFTLGESIDNLEMLMPVNCSFEVDSQMIPTTNTLPYQQFNSLKKIADTNLDTCFECMKNITQKIILQHNERVIRLEYETNTFPFLQVFTPPHRKSIAIEPMTSAPNAFNNGLGMQKLAPSEIQEFVFSIYKG